eukprot:6640192-Lingulodinium_polyedra.AAC.1
MAGVGQHLRALLAQAHQGSWSIVQGSLLPSIATSGSKAGDPLGGVLFVGVVTRLLQHISTKLREAGL